MLDRATCESSCECFKYASEIGWGEVVSGLLRDFVLGGWWSEVLQSGGVVPNPASTRSAFKVPGGRGYVVVADCRRGSFVFWGRVS